MNASPSNPLLEQFLSEAHDLLESISKNLLQLEEAPDDPNVLNELFRSVHTLKGNSGLFTWPEMTRVLHAGEDLLGMVRSGNASYSRELADPLLEAMDFVDALCREIEVTEHIDARRAAESQHIAEGLRNLMPSENAGPGEVPIAAAPPSAKVPEQKLPPGSIPEGVRMAAFRQCHRGDSLFWVGYRPERECFFHGDDPLNSARHCPGLLWGRVFAREPLPALTELDTYSCVLGFQLLTVASREELAEYYRYLPDQVEISPVAPLLLVIPQGSLDGPAAEKHFCAEALRMLQAADFASLRSFVQAMHDDGRVESWLASTLRWLLCLLEDPEWMEHNARSVSLLIESLESFVAPDWIDPTVVSTATAENGASGSDGLPSTSPQPSQRTTAPHGTTFSLRRSRSLISKTDLHGTQGGCRQSQPCSPISARRPAILPRGIKSKPHWPKPCPPAGIRLCWHGSTRARISSRLQAFRPRLPSMSVTALARPFQARTPPLRSKTTPEKLRRTMG